MRSENTWQDQRPFSSSRITPDLQIHSFSSSVHLTHLLQVQVRETPDTRSETIPSSRITPDLQIHSFPLQFTHSSSTGFRSENTWHEIRDHSFIQNHSRSSDSQLLLFSSPHSSSTGFRSENTWHEIRDHSFIQNHSRSSDSQLLLFSSPHSSSTGFRSENTWHEIRDHSFIQNHSRSSDSQLSSSVHLTHLLQGSGQRTPDTRSETIPSSRITPDLQIHSFSSSVHSLIFYRVQVREHLTRDQRPFLHPESLQIFRFTASLFSSPHSLLQGSGQRTLTRDQRPFLHPESLQIFRFTASLFSSLTHLLQGSDQRTPDTRSEIIPSSRITPDLQIHSFFSSVHSLIFYRVQVREPDTRSETIPSSRITPDLQIHSFSLQFTHSSSTGFRSENTWHEIRDHSFIQNHSRSSDSQLLSSVHSLIFYRVQVREHLTRDQRPFLHPESLQIFRFTASLFSSLTRLLQGSGQRKPDTRSETIPSSRITPDLQIHSFSSSVHLTHLLQGSGQRTPDTRSETIPSSRITPDLQSHSFISSVHSLIFYRVQIREHLTRDQRPFLHPESLQIFRFTASSLQFTHSSSTGFRSENTWHEIRDHSFIQNHSRSSDHSFFSSVHSLIFYRVQIREHLTRDQRPFLHPESLQIFRFTASPLQFTSLIFYRVQVREHLTRDQRPLLHLESLQIFRFTASSLQFTHSSSTGFRSENTWHEIRDHSFIQNHSRSSDSQLLPLQFTSLIFYRIQIRESPDTRSEAIPSSRITPDLQIHSFSSSVHSLIFYRIQDQRTPDTRSEIIPSSRITPDLQSHSFFSSVHSLIFYRVQVREHLTRDQRPFLHPESLQIFRFTASSLQFTHSCSTGFRSEDWNGQSRSLVLCSVTHFCVVFEVCVWIIAWLEDPNMAHYNISNRVSHLLIFYLLIFDIIHDAMCLNKISRTSSRNIGPQHQTKHTAVYFIVHMSTFYPCVHKPILSVWFHLTIEASPIWRSSRVW